MDLLYRNYYLNGNRHGLIDNLLVILGGSGRNMGTIYRLLNEVFEPNFQIDRVLVAINQVDIAMKGRRWDEQSNCLDSVLHGFLEEKLDFIRSRLVEATGFRVSLLVHCST